MTMKQTFVLDIGGTSIKYGMISAEGRLFDEGETPTHAEEGGRALLGRVVSLAEQRRGSFEAIGVSTCGQVNRAEGSILYATDNVPGYTGTQIGKTLRETFEVPAAVENDVNAAALGEAKFGAAKDFENFLCITYGTGIGGAIVLNGRLYAGRNGSAGELGHMITHAGGKPCTCGGRGCYEAYASTGALSRMAAEALGGEWNGRSLFEALRAGNDRVRAVVDGWCEEIAVGLASLVHTFEPEAIVLGGGIMREPYVLQLLQERVPQMVMQSFRGVRLVSAALGNHAGLFGAFASVNGI